MTKKVSHHPKKVDLGEEPSKAFRLPTTHVEPVAHVEPEPEPLNGGLLNLIADLQAENAKLRADVEALHGLLRVVPTEPPPAPKPPPPVVQVIKNRRPGRQ